MTAKIMMETLNWHVSVADAEYSDRVKQFALSKIRAKWTVTLSNADGDVLNKRTWGAFPELTPNEEEPTE